MIVNPAYIFEMVIAYIFDWLIAHFFEWVVSEGFSCTYAKYRSDQQDQRG
jgi:hypothetical protein